MSSILEQFGEIFRNRSRLHALMTLAKKLRRVPEDRLLFVGPSIIARYYWCAMQAGYVAREDEVSSFTQFLAARTYNAFKLGFIKKMPDREEEILRIGEEITLDDVWRLFSNNQAYSMKAQNKNGIRFDKDYLIELAKVEESPMTRGLMLEEALAEEYQTISWGFDWGEFVIVGEPDGIGDGLVYEFKTTTTLWYMKPVAFAQADLYAYFFKKATKRVQIYTVDRGEMNTWELSADLNAAEQTLEKFRAVIDGEVPLPPKAWKCKTCKFTAHCPIKPPQHSQYELF